MGRPMALRILRAGYPLTVFNRTPAKAAGLVLEGARRGRLSLSSAKALAKLDRRAMRHGLGPRDDAVLFEPVHRA